MHVFVFVVILFSSAFDDLAASCSRQQGKQYSACVVRKQPSTVKQFPL